MSAERSSGASISIPHVIIHTSPFLLLRGRRWTIQWKGGATWASRARAQHRLEDHSHPCARKQLLQSGHCHRQRYSRCRRAAILKTGRVRAWDRWRRLWRRRLVRTVSARVSPSRFAHLLATALGVAPIFTGLLSLSPVVLSLLSLGSFSLPQPSSLLDALLTACLEPWSVFKIPTWSLRTPSWWTAPLSSPGSSRSCSADTPGGPRAARPPVGSDLCPAGAGGEFRSPGVRGQLGLWSCRGRRDTQ